MTDAAHRGHELPIAPEPSVYLLRHGETEWSRSGQHTSRTDIPLTMHGEQQARDAGIVLTSLLSGRPPTTVLSSPRQRALRTAELAGLRTETVEVEPDLAEWDYGDYEGLRTEEIRRSLPDWTLWTHPCPGGEDADDVAARADAVLDTARKRLADGDVVLVGHGHFSRVLTARWLSLPATDGVRFRLDTAAVTVLGAERGVPQVSRANVARLT